VAKWDPGLNEREQIAPGIELTRVKLATLGLPRKLPWQAVKEVEWHSKVVRLARGLNPSVVVCHSIRPLRAAVAIKRATGASLLYDAHELETECTQPRGLLRRLDKVMERRLIRHCDAVVCVGDLIADWYAREYRIARPAVVRNIPDSRIGTGAGDPPALRERFNVPENALLFIYSGGLFPGRRVEQMLRVFPRLGTSRQIIFMGYGPLEQAVRTSSATCRNVHFLPAVPAPEVIRFAARCDVGVVGVENVCLSNYYSLPNKLFEYLLAGVPILAPDFPEMRGVVARHECGWLVPEGDEAWLGAIRDLSPEGVHRAGERARMAAALYSWANEEQVFLKAYRQAMESRRA
jgi:glycosyltransferase involved in cell wall biosynthesis